MPGPLDHPLDRGWRRRSGEGSPGRLRWAGLDAADLAPLAATGVVGVLEPRAAAGAAPVAP